MRPTDGALGRRLRPVGAAATMAALALLAAACAGGGTGDSGHSNSKAGANGTA